MCRILAVVSSEAFDVAEHLESFACVARDSVEFQGHGWGCAVWRDGGWRVYKSIDPVWEDDLGRFGRTTRLVVHARSAFRNEGIEVKNNMPFGDASRVFVFNGELRGVRIREEGRIGAEKIFNYIKRFHASGNGFGGAFRKAVGIIERRSGFVRGMNIIAADGERLYLNSLFDPGEASYFTMFKKRVGEMLMLCSEPYPGDMGWRPVENRTVEVYS